MFYYPWSSPVLPFICRIQYGSQFYNHCPSSPNRSFTKRIFTRMIVVFKFEMDRNPFFLVRGPLSDATSASISSKRYLALSRALTALRENTSCHRMFRVSHLLRGMIVWIRIASTSTERMLSELICTVSQDSYEIWAPKLGGIRQRLNEEATSQIELVLNEARLKDVVGHSSQVDEDWSVKKACLRVYK